MVAFKLAIVTIHSPRIARPSEPLRLHLDLMGSLIESNKTGLAIFVKQYGVVVPHYIVVVGLAAGAECLDHHSPSSLLESWKLCQLWLKRQDALGLLHLGDVSKLEHIQVRMMRSGWWCHRSAVNVFGDWSCSIPDPLIKAPADETTRPIKLRKSIFGAWECLHFLSAPMVSLVDGRQI